VPLIATEHLAIVKPAACAAEHALSVNMAGEAPMPSKHDEWPYAEITPTLAEILSLLREGFRAKAIARRRGVAITTVRTQIAALESLVGCHSYGRTSRVVGEQ
jgi:DNA-binding NarL/FixJ family response regulator